MVKIPNITGLRFFLALCVVLFHTSEFCSKHAIPFYNDLSIFNKGHEAVCVFFSLSGFLIIRQLYIEKATFQTISLKNFYLRRALRIFPLYFLVLFYGLAHYHLILPTFGYEGDYNTNYNLWEGIALSIFFMPNVFASIYHPGGIIEILWSIGVEEQFYLIIAPLLLLFPLKNYIRFLLVFTITAFVIYHFLEHNFLAKFGILFFYFTSSGVISILLFERKIIFNRKVVNYILLSLFVAYFTTDFFVSYFSSATYNFISMLLFALVIGSLSCKSYELLNNKTITYFGKISYGIYMFHAIVIQIIGLTYTKLFSGMELNSFLIIVFYNLIVIVVTITVSHFSYQYFEKFFMKFYPKTPY
ncbi:acyltransferase family protein [Flavobacterium sp. SM2513]|uniref:acyltransferase family protein n=1 Tax=Flavobacterium sp. SM2513 TaxID=3424766 RepID=UPI003D7FE2AF